MNLIHAILDHAAAKPSAVALIDGERRITYREFADLTCGTAAQLIQHGIGAGDRVGICLGDHPDHLVMAFAVAAVGAIFVPLDARGRPSENARIANALGIKLILHEETSAPIDATGTVPFDASWRRAVAATPPLQTFAEDGDAPFLVSPTSGTTGAPKYMVKSQVQIRLIETIRNAPFLHGKPFRVLSVLPFYFNAGLQRAICHLLRGDTIFLHPALFSAEEYRDFANREAITCALVVPTMLRKLLAIADGVAPLFPTMEGFFCGGSALSAHEKRAVRRNLTPNFYEQYSTAATGSITTLMPAEMDAHIESVGRAHRYGRLEIVDEYDLPVPTGRIGRVRFNSPTTGTGLAGATEGEAPDEGVRDGWYYTGDIGSLDAEGYLYLTGRAADVISRGGASIYPAEIEARLLQHPEVAEAAVVGIPDGHGEDETIAFVVLRAPVSIGALIAHCRADLSAYKVPRQIRVIPELPKNRSGKVDKKILRERFAATR